MRLVKIAAVTILVLLIPHQAPLAGSADGTESVTAVDQAGPALPGAAGDLSAARSGIGGREEIQAGDGFVWSAPAPARLEASFSSSDNVETDGYSWSVRSSGPNPALEPTL